MRLDEVDLLKFGNTIQLAGAVYIGEGQVILALFPDETGVITDGHAFVSPKGNIGISCLNMSLEEWNRFLLQTDVMETEIIERASDGTLAKAIVRKSQRVIAQAVSWSVYKRDGYRCRYCGADDVPLTVDHIIPWEKLGPSIAINLLSCCRKDNRIRGNLSYAEWLRHPRYLAVSKNLSPEVLASNNAVMATLDRIPRLLNQPSR